MDNHAKYTAGAGHAIYTARVYPKEYWNRVAFVGEPTAHLLGQFLLQPQGSAFIARNDFNFVASDDEWTSPDRRRSRARRSVLDDRLVQLHHPAQPYSQGL